MPAADAHADRGAARRRAVAIFAASLVPAAIDAAHGFASGARAPLGGLAFTTASALVELAALTFAFDLVMRQRMTNARSFVLSFVVAIGLGVLTGYVGWAIERGFDVRILGRMHRTASIIAEVGAFNGVVALGLWAMAVVLPFAVGDANARALEAERLRTAAELARLRANLQPHFLLNTLSTVAGLVGEDPREARNLVGALGDLLRDSLEETDEMQTLDDEVSWLKRYAGILEARHRGFLTFRWDIAEATRAVRIPRLLLQPLLENAVKHGALRRREGGEVSVLTTREPGRLGRVTCVVEDNGPGLAQRATRPGALGIEIVTRRLALKYAGAAAFRLEADGGRTRSIVEIPAEAAS